MPEESQLGRHNRSKLRAIPDQSLLHYSIFQKSMPAACGGVSTSATTFLASRSTTSTVPGCSPMPSTVKNANRLSSETTTPCTTLRLVGSRASSLALAASKMETEASRLLVARRSLPSDVTPRLYTPFPAAMRRTSFHSFVSTSTISLDLLQATNTRLPSFEGCAQVGLQVIAGILMGMVMPSRCSIFSCGNPEKPCSFPALMQKLRETFIFSASTSTKRSF